MNPVYSFPNDFLLRLEIGNCHIVLIYELNIFQDKQY